MRKSLSAIILMLALMVPLLAACGGSTPAAPTAAPAAATAAPAATEPTAAPAAPAPTAAPAAGAGTLKIGMVTDIAKLGDKSFNDSAWAGVQLAAKDLGVEPKVIETTDPNDYEKNIGQFVSEGYNVIVTVGFALAEATNVAAKANPEVKFIGVDQFQAEELPNVAGLIFNEDQAGYLAGYLAASVSKSGKIGAVLGTDAVPPVWRFGEGYRAGALAAKPDVKVQTVYHNDVGFDKTFSDPDWGKATALSMIDQGVDIVFGAGGRTGNGALFAAADRKDKGVLAIGVDTDQYLSVPEAKAVLLTSAFKVLDQGTADLIKKAADGSFKGGNNFGEVGLAPFHDQESAVPAALKTKIEDIRKQLLDGSLKTGVAPAKPADGAAPTAAPAAGAGTLKIGMVTDIAKLGDKSFNDSAWAGVQLAAKDLGVEPKVIETTDPNDYEKNIGQFVSEGYNVIVTVGFALAEATNVAAKANPEVKFIGVDQFQAEELPNVAGLIFNEDQAGYLAGYLAASVSKSGKIGAVLGTDAVPPVWRFGEGYRAGALAAKPDVKVQTVYHNDVGFDKTFSDPDWGKATALSMIDQGVDIVFGAGGRTGNGALFAAADRKDKGVLAIGVDTDQYLSVPEAKAVLLTSAFKVLDQGTADLIKKAADGSFKGGNNFGEVGLAPFHDQESAVPAALKTKIEDIRKQLLDGSLKTGVAPAKPA